MQLDYANILRAGQGLVPNLREQMMQDQQAEMQRQAFDMKRQEFEQAQIEQAKQRQREQAFQEARDNALLSGDPVAINRLRLQFPEFTKDMKDAFDALDDDRKRTDLTQLGSIFSRGQNGDFEGAATILEARLKADRDAGEPDERGEAILAALRSGDAVQQRFALGEVGMILASVAPDKFGETYAKLNPTEAQPSIQREVDYYRSIGRDDLAEQLLINKADPLVQITGPAGTSVIPRSQALGGMPAQQGGGDPAVPATGAAIEQAAVSAIPGVKVTSRKRTPEQNRRVGGVERSYHLTDQARDFVPPPGMSMGQLATQLKQTLPGFKVINEGDHVHVEPTRSASRGPVTVRTVQEANKLEPGTRYRTPDGREFIR